MEKKKLKAVCLFCGEEFEYDFDGVWNWIEPPKRKFCGDSSWSTDFNWCKTLDDKFPEPFNSYVWLCGIYKNQIGYHGDTEIKPFKSDEWEEHYQILSAQYDKDAKEYYS